MYNRVRVATLRMYYPHADSEKKREKRGDYVARNNNKGETVCYVSSARESRGKDDYRRDGGWLYQSGWAEVGAVGSMNELARGGGRQRGEGGGGTDDAGTGGWKVSECRGR